MIHRPSPEKGARRELLAADVEEFLSRGGVIDEVPNGKTGVTELGVGHMVQQQVLPGGLLPEHMKIARERAERMRAKSRPMKSSYNERTE